MFERCKYANDCDAQCDGAIENSETCDSFQLHQQLEQAVTQYNQVVKQNRDLQSECNVYKKALEEIKEIAGKFDYWNSNLPEASNVINDIKEKIKEVQNG
jgi:DNA repair exonuclease SbcCD ATPase subunit